MVERLLRINLNELRVIRVICNKCKTTVEAPISEIGKAMRDGKCSTCGESLRSDSEFDDLASRIAQLSDGKRAASVEFVLRQDD